MLEQTKVNVRYRVQAAPPHRAPRRSPMPANFMLDPQELLRFLPEIILILAGTLLMVLEPLIARAQPQARSATSACWRCWPPWRAAIDAYGIAGPAFRRHADGGRLRHVLPRAGDRRRHPDRALLLPLPGAGRTRRPANTTRCCCSRSSGQCLMAAAERADHGLHRPGDLLHRQLRPGRLPARRQAQQRIGAQILPAGLASPPRSSFTAWR